MKKRNGLDSWKTIAEPVHVISLGAGRQSSVMYLMAAKGEILPLPDCAIFADTGNEPCWVYEQLDYLHKFESVIPIIVVKNGNIYDDTMSAVGGEIPWGNGRWVGPPVFSEGGGPIRRKCTYHYKIKPKEAEIRRILKERQKKFVVDWRGHTTTEINRAKPDNRNYYIVRWPLLEKRMSDHDCERWLLKNGHPLFKWSACEICPFRLRDQIKAKILMSDESAKNRIVSVDEGIRDLSEFGLDKKQYLNPDYISMIDFYNKPEITDDNQMILFDCDGGVCGL